MYNFFDYKGFIDARNIINDTVEYWFTDYKENDNGF